MTELQDRVRSPREVSLERLRDAYRSWLGPFAVTCGPAFKIALGRLALISFGPPEPVPSGWAWPIQGGLLARRAGGEMRLQWEGQELIASVSGFAPRLPESAYRACQGPLHHLLTRLFLLDLRGFEPRAGPAPGGGRRLAAGVIDVAACALLARGLRRGPAGFVAVAAGYHLGLWGGGGRTLGAAVLGIRVVARDGSQLSWGQAALRLLALPLCLRRRAPVHDRVARSTVVGSARG